MELTKVYFLHLGIEIWPNFNVLPVDHWHSVVCPIELMSWSVGVFDSLGFCISLVSLSSPWTDSLVIASAVIPPTSLASSLTCPSRYLLQSHNSSASSICSRMTPHTVLHSGYVVLQCSQSRLMIVFGFKCLALTQLGWYFFICNVVVLTNNEILKEAEPTFISTHNFTWVLVVIFDPHQFLELY